MSISPEQAASLLGDFYAERRDNQWRSVANLLDALILEKILPYKDLAAISLGFGGDAAFEVLIKRAQKLSNRTGNAGKREAEKLAVAALAHSTENILSPTSYKIGAHILRISFGKQHEIPLGNFFEKSLFLTQEGISKLSRNATMHPTLKEAIDAENINQILKERDIYIENELNRRDRYLSVCIAGLTGQLDIWATIDNLLGKHSYPYPYEYEQLITQSCLTRFLKNSIIDIDQLHPLPAKFQTEDTIQLPLLSALSSRKGANYENIRKARTSAERISIQALLEIIALRQKV